MATSAYFPSKWVGASANDSSAPSSNLGPFWEIKVADLTSTFSKRFLSHRGSRDSSGCRPRWYEETAKADETRIKRLIFEGRLVVHSENKVISRSRGTSFPKALMKSAGKKRREVTSVPHYSDSNVGSNSKLKVNIAKSHLKLGCAPVFAAALASKRRLFIPANSWKTKSFMLLF